LAPHYVCELERDGPLDRMTVRVELKADRPDRASEAGARAALEHAIKSYVGISATVVVEQPGTIERSTGKARRVIDRRPKR
jgi:phenylacetate-CoA ligase